MPVDNPLVSVLMTAYNRELYITEAIESVLSSTYKNFELIIVDDASADSSVAIAQRFEKKDSRIKLYVNEKNLGDYPNRNRAASHATGEYLMYVDSDDTIFKDGIENCVAVMMRFPAAGLGLYNTSYKAEPFLLNSATAIRDHFFKTPFLFVGPGGTIIRRSFFEQIHGYPEKYGPANDMYFNIKASCVSSIVILTFEFVNYRRHEGQEINNSLGYLLNTYVYLKDAIADLPLDLTKKELLWIQRKNKRRFIINLCNYFLKTGDFRKIKEILQATKFRFTDAIEAVFHL